MIELVQNALITILFLLLFLHVSILFKIVPYDIIWGGRLKSDKEMVRFETVSILVTLLLLGFMLIQSKIIQLTIPGNIRSIILYLMTVFFMMNTIGNLRSTNRIEKTFFTPFSVILCLLFLYLALQT